MNTSYQLTKLAPVNIQKIIDRIWPVTGPDVLKINSRQVRSRQDIIAIATKEFGLTLKVITAKFLSPDLQVPPKDVVRSIKSYFYKPTV